MFKVIHPIQINNKHTFNNTLNNNHDIVKRVHELTLKNITINSLLYFIKMNPECLSYVFRIVPTPLILYLYQQYGFFYSYWNEELVNYLIKVNKMHIHNKIINNYEYRDELLDIYNSVSCTYNFTEKVLNKRLDDIQQTFNKLNLSEFFLGTNLMLYLGYNKSKTVNIKNNVFDIYAKNNININTTGKGIIYITKEYIVYKIDKYYIRIHKNTVTDIKQLFYNTDETIVYDSSNNEILTTFEGYQSLLKYEPNNIIIDDSLLNTTYIWNRIKITKKMAVKRNLDTHKCYVCKRIYDTKVVLDTYNSMCLKCAYFNYKHKHETADMRGKTALVTGIRHKIGLEITLKLLRAGAKVIGTTRFSHATWYNYRKQPDFEEWKNRLIVFKCDFLKLTEVDKLIEYVRTEDLNIIINNACQTIRMTKECHNNILTWNNIVLKLGNIEHIELDTIENIHETTDTQLTKVKTYDTQLTKVKTERSITEYSAYEAKAIYFPFWSDSKMEIIKKELHRTGLVFNKFNDIKDTPHDSSWTQNIEAIDYCEILEANFINQLVPTLIINKLKPIMKGDKFIINVVALEGQFNCKKNSHHAHTNMCKAAMNMLIRTLSEEDDKDLHVYAIDPGYVTGINPQLDEYPIEPEDGASRILYPIIRFHNGFPLDKDHVKLRNYKKIDW
jgi:NAD(P)-dependent dehydrogenase (short-subunit alcohol dehydrogenase family)